MSIPWNMNDTLTLLQAVEQVKKPETFFLDTFFPNKPPVSTTSYVAVEYKKRGRQAIAPYIVSSEVKGVNIGRSGSKMRVYAPPMIGPRRTLSLGDIERRMFGETPVFSTMTPEQRASAIIAQDIRDLMDMIQNRKNKIAVDILTTGKTEITGYADDGVLTKVDTIDFTEDWDGNVVLVNDSDKWSNPNAKIFDQLQSWSEKIQEDLGLIPTTLIVGKNVPKYLRQNKEILDWLMIPNRQNLTMASLAPHYTSPQTMYVGRIDALNLEIYSYAQTYVDNDGKVKPFLPENSVIMAVPGKGSEIHGALTMMDDEGKNFRTYAVDMLPRYITDKMTNSMSFTIYSRFLLVPSLLDSWIHCSVAD